MRTIAFATPLSLSEQNSMLPRLTVLANWGRGLVSRRDRLFRRTTEPVAASQHRPHCAHCLARATKQVEDRPITPIGKQENPSGPAFIRTQSQIMETMLKSMILASGWNVDGRNGRP